MNVEYIDQLCMHAKLHKHCSCMNIEIFIIILTIFKVKQDHTYCLDIYYPG